MTEDTWDEVQTSSEYGGRGDSTRYSQGPLLGPTGSSGYGTATSASGIPSSGPYMQQTSSLQTGYPYNDHHR